MKNKQMTLAGSGFEKYAKTTRRAQFLAEMERVVPWGELCALIEPVYPKGEGGRPPVPLERMLRVYFAGQSRCSARGASATASARCASFEKNRGQLLP